MSRHEPPTVHPLADGQWVAIVEHSDKTGEFAIARFPSEYAAETWASAAEREARPLEVVRENAFDDFWQNIEWLAYFVDGEPAAARRKRIEHFLAHDFAPPLNSPFEASRRRAVRHLLEIWIAGPLELESQKHWARGIADALGAKTMDEVLDEIKGSDSTH